MKMKKHVQALTVVKTGVGSGHGNRASNEGSNEDKDSLKLHIDVDYGIVRGSVGSGVSI